MNFQKVSLKQRRFCDQTESVRYESETTVKRPSAPLAAIQTLIAFTIQEEITK
jgi:hypothetical protein